MALHEQSVGATYTSRYIFTALGCTVDMDVASPAGRDTVDPREGLDHQQQHAATLDWVRLDELRAIASAQAGADGRVTSRRGVGT